MSAKSKKAERTTPEQRAEIMRELEASGKSVVDFANEKNLSSQLIYLWRSVARAEEKKAAKRARKQQPESASEEDFSFSRGQKEQHVRTWRESDETAEEYAKRIGVPKKALYGWSAAVNRQEKQRPRKPDEPRKMRTPEEKIQILKDWEASGLDGVEFAKTIGVSDAQLYRWRKTYRAQLNGTPQRSELPKAAAPAAAPLLCPHCGGDIAAGYEQQAMKVRAMQKLKF